eukprot:CAMPEP_0202907430 /NCGR_PEP_ID=MMETSP1392-20130828/42467_1 /ASSEMBLY_ACC=CAM_ASM_000868 /TAXON_ID=225041 /ORGANISM="Chlamydomonas chlamydogama, Strain SAG 11-48b" /LENGTH=48 /DNA_ID= /DNA_START= /DNA_END= /DNA_ORIENTATION=
MCCCPPQSRPDGYMDQRAYDIAARYGYVAQGTPVYQGQPYHPSAQTQA